jgi:hypothetical protein
MSIATATAADTIERVFKPIQQFTRGWMLAESTGRHGIDLGFASGSHFWIVGRAGVLGSCPVEVAVGGVAFHAPEQVEVAWNGVPDGLSHYDVSLIYLELIRAWGDETLTVFDPDRLEAIDTLGRRIIDAAPACLGLLFAGWRQLPIPQSLPARVALTTQVLREMRGAAHVNAIVGCGLSPLDAILASTNAPPRTGPDYAERFGWKGPFRNPDEVRAARLEAEQLTAETLEPYFNVLSPQELAHFGEVVETTRNAIDM